MTPIERDLRSFVEKLAETNAEANRLNEEVREWDAMQSSPAAEALRTAAQKHCKDGEIEVDEDAVVSFGDDPGAYVAGWIWVYNSEAGLPEPEDEE